MILRTVLTAFVSVVLLSGSVARGDFLVADSGTDTVLRYSAATNSYTTLVSGDAQLSGPTGLAIDAGGNLLVSSRNFNTIRRYDAVNGSFINQFAVAAPLPTDIRFRSNGNLLVAKLVGTGIEQFTPGGTSLGDFTSGAALMGAASFAFGPDGDLYVGSFGDLGNEGAGGSIMVFDGNSGAFLRQLSIPFQGASALLFDGLGNLWATSVYENRVIRMNAAGSGSILSEFSPGAFTFPQSMVLSPYGASELLIGLGGPGLGTPGVYRFDFAGNNLGLVGTGLGLPGNILPIPEPAGALVLPLLAMAVGLGRRRK